MLVESARCAYPDCEEAPVWSVHEEGTHPADIFESCSKHLGRLLDEGGRYVVFPALSDLPKDER